VRVFRVLKLGTHYGKMQVMWNTMVESLDVLAMMGFLMGLSVIIFSAMIYNMEFNDPDEDFDAHGFPTPVSKFNSIPTSFWWCIVTLMTVGYGDYVPVTVLGKMTAAGAMLVSVFILALPITVIGTNFNQQWDAFKNQSKFANSKLSAPMLKNLSKKVNNHCSLLDDVLKHVTRLEVENADHTSKLQEKIQQLQVSLAPSKKVTGFLGFISSSKKDNLTDSNIRKCMLKQHADEMLKYRANNTAEALINLLQDPKVRDPLGEEDFKPDNNDIHISKTEKLFGEMKMNGEDDPVETLTSVLELERTLRGSVDILKDVSIRTDLIVGGDIHDLCFQSCQQYRTLSQLVGQSTVLAAELNELSKSYSLENPHLLMERKPLTQKALSKVKSALKNSQMSAAEALERKLNKLCDMLKDREETKDMEDLSLLQNARERVGVRKSVPAGLKSSFDLMGTSTRAGN